MWVIFSIVRVYVTAKIVNMLAKDRLQARTAVWLLKEMQCMLRTASRLMSLPVVLVIVSLSMSGSSVGEETSADTKVYPCRWYFNFGKDFDDDASLEAIKNYADIAAAHDL